MGIQSSQQLSPMLFSFSYRIGNLPLGFELGTYFELALVEGGAQGK